MGEVITINETDFIWMNGKPKGITHAVLFDAVGSDHIPAVVGASLVKDLQPIGYMSSKHIASSPHTLISSLGFTGWPIYYGPDKKTIVIEVLTPAHISRDMSAQKNAWLFNYPPARDVARMLNDLGCKSFCVLTSDAFDIREGKGLEEPYIVKGEEIGSDELGIESLQTLWGWLPAFMFAIESKGSTVMVIPSHGHTMESKDFSDTHIKNSLEALKEIGFNCSGSLKRAKDLYHKASSDTIEAAKMADDVITKMRNKTRASHYEGGMFG